MNERQTAAKTQRRHWCSNANAIKYYFFHTEFDRQYRLNCVLKLLSKIYVVYYRLHSVELSVV